MNIIKFVSYIAATRAIGYLCKGKIKEKFPYIYRYVAPLGVMFCHYRSLDVLSDILGGSESFLHYMLSSYFSYHKWCFYFSLSSLVLGYPIVKYISYYALDMASEFAKPIVRAIQNVSDMAKTNQNWDIVLFDHFSFKTWSVPIPITSDEELNKLVPLRCKGSDNITDSKFVNDQCSICMEDIVPTQLHRELPCEHVFHPQCVDTWLLKCNATCPLCRKAITL